MLPSSATVLFSVDGTAVDFLCDLKQDICDFTLLEFEIDICNPSINPMSAASL